MRHAPRLCSQGACRAGRRFASFRPSAFPWQATKRVSLASFWSWGAGAPVPLRFVLARLLGARSLRRPGACARARLFPAVPVGAGGWGREAGHALAPLSGGGRGHLPPCLGGVGAGAPAACGPPRGSGGESRRGIPAPSLGGCPRFLTLAPLLSSAHTPPACAFGRGRGAAPGGGGMRDDPWTAPPGAASDLSPPSALPEWAMVMVGVMGGAAPILFWCAAGCRPQAWSVRSSGALVWARLSGAPPAGAGGWGRWGARCAGPAASPPPRVAVSSGGGGASPRPQGGGGSLLWPSSWKGERGGGGGRAAPPNAPPPRRASACHLLSPARPPWGILVPWGLPGGRGRQARPGQPPMGQCGGGGREGGGGPPALVGAPAFLRPASEGAAPFAPSSAPPVRRRPAAGRAGACQRSTGGACRGRGAPSPWVQRPLWGGCGAAVSSVCLRPLLGLRGRGGELGGGFWSHGVAP